VNRKQWIACACRLAVVALGLMLWPSAASADSASIDSVHDAGGGQMTVTYTVSSTAVGEFGFSGWFAYLAEDHSSRACNVSWANYLRHVVSFQQSAGSVTSTVTFRPFFPRQIKLCVYLRNPAGERALFEQAVSIPTGYGVQRSSGYNCSHFSRYSAQDYYWLYPGDPSGLDADNDGAACESNSGPGPGPPIPPEPSPAVQQTACSDGIDNDGDGATDLLDSYCVTASGTSEGSPPPTKPQCDDGRDNDGDGAIDYLYDEQCTSFSDNSEGSPPKPQCTDGRDNDGDSAIDYPNDEQCTSLSGTSEGPRPKPQCNDGRDNDGDGAIDYPDDEQCKLRADKREAPDPLRRLSTPTTKRYIRTALRREFQASYRFGSFKRITRCVRSSRTRMKCRRVSWGIGDLGYRGWVTIWYANSTSGDVSWKYAFRIKRTNGYCVVRKRAGDPDYRSDRCTKVYRVR
jgi:hypothetical protein